MKQKTKAKAEAESLSSALHSASQMSAVAAIRLGLTQVRKGSGRQAAEVFDDLEHEASR
jgi:hypothetical protein